MTKSLIAASLLTQSTEAKKFWGKVVEDKLPLPALPENIHEVLPSEFLYDIVHYARGAESRGEYLFRTNYLQPLFKHFAEKLEECTWEEDALGNMFVTVGTAPTVLHVGHVDTVHDDDVSPYQDVTVTAQNILKLAPLVKNSVPKLSKGDRWVNDSKEVHNYITYELPPKQQRCLGADDGCAVAMMLFLIANNVEGMYIFARGEEVGCVGTHYILDNGFDFSPYKCAIEVDRKGTKEIIGTMSVGTTASPAFITSLAEQLSMGHKAGTGTITDVGHIAKEVPECVNISAGYDLQHSDRESTDMIYLDKLGEQLLQVDWETLTISREAGQYARAIAPVHSYSDGYYSGGNYTRRAGANMYGDYTREPSTDLVPFCEKFAATQTFQRAAWVRSNAEFISEFFEYLNLSPAQMENLMEYDSLTAPDEINDTNGETP